MWQPAEHAGQGGQVHPLPSTAAVVESVVNAIGTGHGQGVGGHEPSRTVSPEHQPVVAPGGIVAEGVAHHLLHHLGVAGILILLADAHIGYRHRVDDLPVADACHPRQFLGLAAVYVDQQGVAAAYEARAGFQLLQAVGHLGRKAVLSSHIYQHRAAFGHHCLAVAAAVVAAVVAAAGRHGRQCAEHHH